MTNSTGSCLDKPTSLHQRSYAKKVPPPQCAKLVELTGKPFIQAITGVLSSHIVFYDGRVILMGDAVAGFRPHTAASTSPAAFHAVQLDKYLRHDSVDRKALKEKLNDMRKGECVMGFNLEIEFNFIGIV